MLNFNYQKGFAAFFVTILFLAVVFGIAVSIFILTYGEQKISKNIVKSSQAYYIAEAGIEDALLRLAKDMNWTSTSTLNVGDGSATIEISDVVGGFRTITSKGNVKNRIRKTEVVYQITAEKTSFYYGAQVGEGGIIMDDKSTITGNVFSNGSIVAKAETKITGTAKVAKTGNKIKGAKIGEDAYVDICENSKITGTLTSASQKKCSASNFVTLTEEITPIALPISQEEIDKWKNEAVSGGIISGEYELQSQEQDFLGPKKIDGTMKIQSQAKLFVTGTIWVTGDVTIQNEAKVRLDEGSYGSFSGIIISDGKITLQNSAKALGSGQPGSFLLLISTLPVDPAIIIQDEFEADILYTSSGWILIQNETHAREVSGYGIHLKNDAEIIYDVGLEDTSFSSGPGGSWEVTSWKEVE